MEAKHRFLLIGLITTILAPACQTTAPVEAVKIGDVATFPRGSITALELKANFQDPDPPPIGSSTPGVVTQPSSATVTPVPVFLVHTPGGEFIALYARDPFRGCRIKWYEEVHRFQDPCHGSRYEKTGEWISGPSDRGMDRFGVSVDAEGQIVIDLTSFRLGETRP